MSKPCDMGVGCDEAGMCYASAHGEPERCPLEPAPVCVWCGCEKPPTGWFSLCYPVALCSSICSASFKDSVQ